MLTAKGFAKAAAYWKLFAEGVACTVSLSALTVFFGFILALALALCRMGKLRLLKFAATAYVEVIRATPMLVQIFIIYYVVFNGVKVLPGYKLYGFIRFERFFPAVVALALNSGAYLCEIIRSGIESVDPGQMEAARSLGMTHWQAMRKVVFPQAIKNSLPAIGNEFIINIKDSSVLCVVGVSDLMFMTRSVAGIYYKGTECYLIAATVYLFLTYLSSLLLKAITGRMTAPDNTKRHQGNQTVDLGLPSSN